MKKGLKIALILLVIAALGVGAYFYLGRNAAKSDEVAYVTPVRMINIASGSSSNNRFSGVVESQQTVAFKKDGNREIEEIYVVEGQEVEEGTALFRYEVRSAENNIAQANLDIEEKNQELAIYRQSATTQSQILARQIEIEIRKIQNDIAGYQQEIDNAQVLSTLKGVVKQVNGDPDDPNTTPIVEVMEVGDYRVKSSIDEQAIWSINVGDPITVRSRVDEQQTWSGTISKIENEPNSDQQNDYYFNGGGSEKASTYPFYVSLDSIEGLILGQHVFVELAQGNPGLTGIWIMPDMIVQDSDRNYVWVSENGKLKKRDVELGDINEEYYAVEIKSGLENSDAIAWPDDTLKEGMTTIDSSNMDNGAIEE